MRIGLFPTGHTAADVEVVLEAERCGYHSIWSAEAYGLDALTPMAWWAARTRTIGLGSVVAVVDGRTPATAAMTATTLDHLSSGRFTLGLGVSGPAVVEGWHGRPFRRPLARTREYVAAIRAVQQGNRMPTPYAGSDALGSGRGLRSSQPPVRAHQPLFLAAEGPKAIALAAEIADGWTAFYVSPAADRWYRDRLDEGFGRRPGGRPDGFEVLAQVHLSIGDDVEAAADPVRRNIALFVGGMGVPGANFHHDTLARIGFADECAAIARLWAAGDRDGAAAAVPLLLVEAIALVGPPDKIRAELPAWRASCVTLMLPMLHGTWDPALVRTVAELFAD